MNILLIGSGGREHALARSLSASALCDRLLIAPGNPGTAQHGTNAVLDVTDHRAVIDFCRVMKVDFVVVGPEAPLVAGLVDDLTAAGIKAFGPSRAVTPGSTTRETSLTATTPANHFETPSTTIVGPVAFIRAPGGSSAARARCRAPR